MRWWSGIILAAYTLSVYEHSWAAAVPFIPQTDQDKNAVVVHNANHIFNAIHSSMRQWGSSLNHNGMSFFMAQVPAGTQFYHGSPFQEPVEGMEWLAFEPEHASFFATRIKRRNDTDDNDGSEVESGDLVQPPSGHDGGIMLQHPILDTRIKPPRYDITPGWLHTYRTKHNLPLLYIDGMSAGKTERGTLDSQDALLLNVTRNQRDGFWDFERARRLCKLSNDKWGGKIKGFIRMEAGFEIIMCSFVENVDFISAVRTGRSLPGGEESEPTEPVRQHLMVWIKAISARYDDIGGDRVKLDHENFITSFAYDLDLFNDGDDLPRLENLSVASLDKVRNDVDTMVNNWGTFDSGAINWQSITDMVVERYAKELPYLVSDSLDTSEAFLHELSTILHVFIDSDHRNSTAEVERCINQFVPTGIKHSGSIAGRAVEAVTRKICSGLFAAFDSNVSVSESKKKLRSLMTYLDWTTWKKCGDCALDEICFIPVWPIGSEEDRIHPRCRNATDIEQRPGGWQVEEFMDMRGTI